LKRLVVTSAVLSLSAAPAVWAQDIPAEYQQVLTTLGKHQHMIDTRPTVYFLHYWGTGSAERLATGVKAALSEFGKGSAATSAKR